MRWSLEPVSRELYSEFQNETECPATHKPIEHRSECENALKNGYLGLSKSQGGAFIHKVHGKNDVRLPYGCIYSGKDVHFNEKIGGNGFFYPGWTQNQRTRGVICKAITASYRIRLRDHPSLCLRAGISSKVQSWKQRPEPWIASSISAVLITAALAVESRCDHECSRTTMPRRHWERTHIFRRGVWWWCFRFGLCLTGVVEVFFIGALSLSTEFGGRSFYCRQIVVHGTLLYIGCFFMHVMVTSRDNDDHQDASKNTTKIQKQQTLKQMLRQMFRRMWRRMLRRWLVRPTLLVHSIIVFGPRAWLAFNFGQYSSEGMEEQHGINGWLWTGLALTVPLMFNTTASMIARVRVDDRQYQGQFLARWLKIFLLQFSVMVSSLFSPGGVASWFPILSVNILVLGVIMEILIGTIPQRTFEAWSSKYHVVLTTIFSLPLLLISVVELVAMLVGSYETFAQVHMHNVGAVGGSSNQMLGSVNSYGWWWGPGGESLMRIMLM